MDSSWENRQQAKKNVRDINDWLDGNISIGEWHSEDDFGVSIDNLSLGEVPDDDLATINFWEMHTDLERRTSELLLASMDSDTDTDILSTSDGLISDCETLECGPSIFDNSFDSFDPLYLWLYLLGRNGKF